MPQHNNLKTREELREHYLRDIDEVNKNTILSIINDLPPILHKYFKRRLTVLLIVEEQKKLVQIIEDKILESDDLSEDINRIADENNLSEKYVRFACFYYLTSYYRRRNDVEDLNNLHEKYAGRFDNKIDDSTDDEEARSISIMYRLADINKMSLNNSRGSEKLIEEIEEIKKVAPDNHIEILHTYVVLLLESIKQDPESDKSEQRLKTVKNQIRKVIEEDSDYGRYHHTRAQVYLFLDEYEQARDSLDRAIRKENPDIYDYEIRMSMYHKEYPEITVSEIESELEKADKLENKIENSIANAEEKVDSLQSNFILFLGFFTGVLTIAIGFINQISNSMGPEGVTIYSAVQFVFGLSSAFVFAFGGLVMLIPSKKISNRIIISVILVVISLVGVLFSFKIIPLINNL